MIKSRKTWDFSSLPLPVWICHYPRLFVDCMIAKYLKVASVNQSFLELEAAVGLLAVLMILSIKLNSISFFAHNLNRTIISLTFLYWIWTYSIPCLLAASWFLWLSYHGNWTIHQLIVLESTWHALVETNHLGTIHSKLEQNNFDKWFFEAIQKYWFYYEL